MSDDELRRLERELVTAPADLELRRRHARLLQRAGQAERALEAIDLAWRLGAEELWLELVGELSARTIRVAGIVLRFVPAGPFVLGSDAHDEDAAPARLVTLSAFHISANVVTREELRGTELWAEWMANDPDVPHHTTRLQDARTTLAAVTAKAGPGWSVALPTEAQWERVFRAGLLRPDGIGPYGVQKGPQLEWTRDLYHPDAYLQGAAKDPVETRPAGLMVVRGAPVPPPVAALYREAADGDGFFSVEKARKRRFWQREEPDPDSRRVRAEEGLGVRLVMTPA